MNGSSWKNLIKSFGYTIEKIIIKDAGTGKSRVSLILFDDSARVICEN
jgi:hypothetical protein